MDKMDTRYLDKTFLTGFIELYKSFPCLWKVNSKAYTNKYLKNEAYQKMVDYCKPSLPNADRDFVVKKIQSIRGSFRKEFKKINDRSAKSRDEGGSDEEAYTPQLWYFDLLLFLKDQNAPAISNGNLQEESLNAFCKEDSDAESEEQLNTTEQEESREELFITPDLVSGNSSPSPSKRKKPEDHPARAVNAFFRAFELSEYEAFGVSVAKKLQKMDPIQAIYSEALIGTVLKKGLLQTLTANTDIQEVVCPSTNSHPQNQNQNSLNTIYSPITPSHSPAGHIKSELAIPISSDSSKIY